MSLFTNNKKRGLTKVFLVSPHSTIVAALTVLVRQ